MRLYEINQAYYDVMDKIIENEGEMTPELLDELNAISSEFNIKAEAKAVLIKQQDARIDAIRTEEKMLKERRERIEKAKDSIKEDLIRTMEIFECNKFETARCKITFRASKAVSIFDEGALPDEYFRVKKEPAKDAIKSALAEGKEVPGAVMVENKNIQIK